MSVVLRCPSCGTTRATPGPCEACHEAEVRWFCTDHEPGLWLDGSTCAACEARLAEAAARRAGERLVAASRRRPEPAPGASGPPTLRSRERAAPPPPRHAPAERPSDVVVRDAREPSRTVDDEAFAPVAPPGAMLGKLLRAALVARTVPTMAPTVAPYEPERMPIARTAFGCVTRLLLLGVLLLLAVVGILLAAGQSLL